MRAVRCRPSFKPWINDELRAVIAKRNRFYRIFKKTTRQSYKILYKRQAKLSHVLNRQLQHNYYTAKFSDTPGTSQIYKILGQMGFGKKRANISALSNFPAQDILDHVAQTYSVHPPCTPSQVAHILRKNLIDNRKPVFEFCELSYQDTLTVFKRAVLTSKGNKFKPRRH